MAQVADAPNGFASSLKVTTTTPESAVAADEYGYVAQKIEAQNLQHLNFGSSAALSLTLSFWVKSSVTGTFGGNLHTPDNAGLANATYTISSANTWEYKTITYTGDTARAITNDVGIGMYVSWHLVAGTSFTSGGSTSNGWAAYHDNKWSGGHAQNGVVTTDNATWQITGAQLEVGSVDTDFQHRSYGEELALCQRYFYIAFIGHRGFTTSASQYIRPYLFFPTTMRATPTLTPIVSVSQSISYSGSNNQAHTRSFGIDLRATGISDSAYWYANLYFDAEL